MTKKIALLITAIWSLIFFLGAGEQQEPSPSLSEIPVLQQTASPFAMDPACNRYTSQVFGLKDTNDKDGTDKYHTGVDIACRLGAKIVAPFTCTIIHAKKDEIGWGTNTICKAKLPNGEEICHRAGHMIKDSLKVVVGQTVLAGQELGLEGNTGFSTGNSGIHAHHQVVDCTNDYPFSEDDGYAGKDGNFEQLRKFYDPLQFFYEWSDPNIVYSSFNMMRHAANGGFSAPSWVSTTPNYLNTSNWDSLTENDWEQKFIRKGYINPNSKTEPVHYYSKYFVSKINGHKIMFRPYLPYGGFWRADLLIPDDQGLRGILNVTISHYYSDKSLRVVSQQVYVDQNNIGKEIQLARYLYCLKGKNCYIEVTLERIDGQENYLGVEGVKWTYIAPFEKYLYAFKLTALLHPVTRAFEAGKSFFYLFPEQTEVGYIKLDYLPQNMKHNIALSAFRIPDSTRQAGALPCFRGVAGVSEYCFFLQGKYLDQLQFYLTNPSQFCVNDSCDGILVTIVNFPVLENLGEFFPHPKTNFADIGTNGTWYRKWLYKATFAGILSGICNEDYRPQNCFLRPDRPINKAEFTKMLIKGTGPMNPSACQNDPYYSDVKKEHWFCPYVSELYNRLPANFKWDSLAPKSFFPDQILRRDIAAFMLFHALRLTPNYNASEDDKHFCDLSGNAYAAEIHTLRKLGIISGFSSKVRDASCLMNFDPSALLLRAQAAKMAYKVFEHSYHTLTYRN